MIKENARRYGLKSCLISVVSLMALTSCASHHHSHSPVSDASPLTHVSAEHPPTFLYHGQRDRLVEKEQSINYYAALRQADVPAELYLHPLWGHIAMFLFGWGAENQGIDFLNQHNM